MINWFKNLLKKKQPKKESTEFKDINSKQQNELFEEKCPTTSPEDGKIISTVLVDKNGETSSPMPLEEAAQILAKKPTLEELIDAVPVIDLRHEQPDPPPLVNGKKKWKTANGHVVKRKSKDVTGITIHQTAARYGVTKQQIEASDGDKRLALARRGLKVACHAIVFWNDGEPFVCLTAPVDWYCYHGNGFNATTLGIEVDGDFAGLLSDPKTAFRKKDNPDRLEEKLKIAFFKGVKTLLEEAQKKGMNIAKVYAHRQSSPTRRSDPGEEIWGAVLEYVVAILGLKTDPGLIKLKGYSIPKEWDVDGTGHYWDEPQK